MISVGAQRKTIVLSGTFNPFDHTHLAALLSARTLADEVVVSLPRVSPPLTTLLRELKLADSVRVHSSPAPMEAVRPEFLVCLDGSLTDSERAMCVPSTTILELDALRQQSYVAWLDSQRQDVVHNYVRPWGDMDIHKADTHFWIKTIRVNPGQRLSLQSHVLRAEIWVALSGHVLAEVDGVMNVVEPGGAITIPVGVKHRLSSEQGGVVVELAFGSQVREDDIVRYADDYKRI